MLHFKKTNIYRPERRARIAEVLEALRKLRIAR
jgi:hypothetical protein